VERVSDVLALTFGESILVVIVLAVVAIALIALARRDWRKANSSMA